MLDDHSRKELDTTNLHDLLAALPGSYAGPRKTLPAPYGAVGYEEGALPLRLTSFVDKSMVAQGTQFLLGNVHDPEGDDLVNIAEVSGAHVQRVGVSQSLKDLDYLVPTQPLSLYTYTQYLAHATGNGEEAEKADQALSVLAERCTFQVPTEQNPAKQMAWSLWTRTPLLLASRSHAPLISAWQHLLGRIGKSMSVPLEFEPLITLSGGFEARHESGDERVALVIGEADAEMQLAREILETRIDEIIPVLPPENLSEYARNLYLWYFGAWVSYYLALTYNQDPRDTKIADLLNAGFKPRADEDDSLN
ncbi:SIS domain-containing protein [Deinococcus roseus]|uniref:Phosphosugar isomerase n=1 Tax=Deinococcus roseus TaxID=392414 RepID=A0ABQ2D3D1_9DEIO|nr:SIS domain-containing protein [Deinococcus roseus]GGJ40714.1 phosphosugar isomerase [Deinococcus roseus]